MADTGSQDDILGRLKRLMPNGWFGPDGSFPAVEAALAGLGAAFARVYALYAFAKLQTRLATMTGGWLELAASDFFDNFKRLRGEIDPRYGRRLRLEVFRDRNTRNAIDRAVYDLTGQHPDVFEAWRPGCCGGLDTPSFALDITGRLGDLTPRFETIISIPQPQNFGIPNWPGLDVSLAGLDANFALVSDDDIIGAGPTTADILAALERVRTASHTYWVNFTQLGDPNP